MSVEAIEGLTSSDLSGVELAIAREDFCCAVRSGATLEHKERALDEFVKALGGAFFGQTRIVEVETVDRAAELLEVQLGCLATAGSLSSAAESTPGQIPEFNLELISEHIEANMSLGATLPASVDLAVRNIAEPYIYTPDTSTAAV